MKVRLSNTFKKVRSMTVIAEADLGTTFWGWMPCIHVRVMQQRYNKEDMKSVSTSASSLEAPPR